MTSIILDSETAQLPLQQLLQQLSSGGIEVRDSEGTIVAIILDPLDKEALTYAEAKLDLAQNRDQVRQALTRRGGITTSQLLAKAVAAAEQAGQQ
jgi:hypothetical protein